MSDEPCGVAVVGDGQVADFVRSARQRVIFIAPAVSGRVSDALSECARALPPGAVTVVLDTDPEVYRLGYGEPAGLAKLEAARDTASLVLRRQPGLRLCIAIADARTLIYAPFPQLIEAGPNTHDGANAIYLDSAPAAVERDLDPAAGRPRIGAEPLSAEHADAVRADLAENPPQKFDIARRMRVFNAYYEFAELELTGIHIDRKRVRIPDYLFGLTDEQTRTRLRSQFQIVPGGSELSGGHLMDQRHDIASKYLKQIRGFGTVVRRVDKPALEEAVEGLRNEVEKFKKTLTENLQGWIDQGRNQLVTALLPGVVRNPPGHWFPESRTPDEESCRRLLEREVARALGPANRLISGMEVTLQFKGLTYEMLNDKAFRAAAEKAGLEVDRLHDEHDAARATSPERS